MGRETLPFALILRLTLSITSTNASFFLYFTSARLQLVTPVAWLVIRDDSSYIGECDEGHIAVWEGREDVQQRCLWKLYSLSLYMFSTCRFHCFGGIRNRLFLNGMPVNEYLHIIVKKVHQYWPSISSYITTKLFFTDSSSILPKYALQILMKR